jgi:GNAT superfamily N-acetyltransferase
MAAANGVSVRAAQPADMPALVQMFRELAEYEHLEDIMLADEQKLAAALFSEPPAAEALIAERDGEPAGYAVFFPTFSTFLCAPGIWLEDVFVRPEHRRGGTGRALLAAVAARLRERGGERLEWSALRWNELALDFYRALGAEPMADWAMHRMTGEPLDRLAADARR